MTVQGPDQTSTRTVRAGRVPARGAGPTGTRWPSARTTPPPQRDDDDREGPARPPRGRSGARFPSAAMLARWQEEDGEGSAAPRSEAPEPEAPGPEGEAVRVGARFPSAALRRRWENEEDEPAEEPSPDPDPAAAADAEPTLEPAPSQLPGAVAAFVRPYVLTGGRTRTARYLGVETLVSAHRNGRAPGHLRDQAHRAVVDLCSRPKSVAEVAALMMVPLGVARVLVGDLAHVGALFVHPAPTPSGMPDAVLMNRVLHGLRRL